MLYADASQMSPTVELALGGRQMIHPEDAVAQERLVSNGSSVWGGVERQPLFPALCDWLRHP